MKFVFRAAAFSMAALAIYLSFFDAKLSKTDRDTATQATQLAEFMEAAERTVIALATEQIWTNIAFGFSGPIPEKVIAKIESARVNYAVAYIEFNKLGSEIAGPKPVTETTNELDAPLSFETRDFGYYFYEIIEQKQYDDNWRFRLDGRIFSLKNGNESTASRGHIFEQPKSIIALLRYATADMRYGGAKAASLAELRFLLFSIAEENAENVARLGLIFAQNTDVPWMDQHVLLAANHKTKNTWEKAKTILYSRASTPALAKEIDAPLSYSYQQNSFALALELYARSRNPNGGRRYDHTNFFTKEIYYKDDPLGWGEDGERDLKKFASQTLPAIKKEILRRIQYP